MIDMYITKKLFLIMTIMAVLITTELVALNVTMRIVSAVRAYVGAEGLWSKAQKDGAYYLMKYAYSANEKDYQNYLNFMKLPLSDHEARLALIKNPLDYNAARKGFLGGQVHPDDIDGIIWLFHRFSNFHYINKAINIWTEGDVLLNKFMQLGEKIHESISNGPASLKEITNQLVNLDRLNQELTVLENDFSYTLGQASRWLENIIFKVLIGIAVTVEFTGILLTIMIGFRISRDVNVINRIASKVAKSDFSERVNTTSKDEIGQLAVSFNAMIDALDNHEKNQQKARQELLERSRSLEEQTAKTKIEQASKNLLLNILESSTEYSIIATDLEGLILVWNEGARRLYGYTMEEMVYKKNARDLFTPGDIQSGKFDNFLKMVLKEEKYESTFTRMRKDGSRFVASLVATLRRDSAGHPVGFDMIAKDITKQKKLEDQLVKSNQELEQFAYVASHDLKAPLRGIERLASWIEEDNSDALDSKSKENLVLLRQRVNRMSNLISGILQYSRTGHMNVQIHNVNLKPLLQGVIDTLNQSRKFNIHYPDHLPTLQGDEIQLGQIFSNLIDNSIKHHDKENGNIEIDFKDREDFYEFFIKDDGPGIAPEYQKKIFQIFQTLKSRDEFESTGIGLSIVKKIVESQGGKIWVDSAEGAGAIFYFTWPKRSPLEIK